MSRLIISRLARIAAGLIAVLFGVTPAAAAINILPLGDSITQGGKSLGNIVYASYRYPLYHKLKAAGYDVNFVGSLSNLNGNLTPSAANYPNYAGTFDRDHQAYWGKTTLYLNQNLNAALVSLPVADKPELVVLNIGTNDANNIPTSTYVTQLTSVIDKLRTANPAVKIVLSNIMVFINHEASCIEFNTAIAALASSLNTVESPVVLADINTALPAAARYDGIHPNFVGEEWLATVYFNAIQSLLGPPHPLTADKLFGSGMVLQRSQPLNVWGSGAPGASVTVSLLNGATPLTSGTALVDGSGQWLVTMPAVSTPGGPFTLTITSGTATLAYDNVLVGDVWLCSGQSNMDLTVKENNANTAFTALVPATDDHIRHFSVEHLHAAMPQESLGDRADETDNQWEVTATPAVDGFSAAGFFFARTYRTTHPTVPVGIIKAAWGSTLIESWLSAEVHASRPDLAARAAVIANDPVNDPVAVGTRQRQPSATYNGMIHPLRRFAIRGFVWYQGESNANAAGVLTYPITQRLLIQSWRELWGGAERPWVTVQLPGFAYSGGPVYWPWLRDAQTTTLQENNTALLGTIDLGSTVADLGDTDRELHPRTKIELGRRLGRLVSARFDGVATVAEGPVPTGVETASPGVLRVTFDLNGSASLTTTGNTAPAGFEVAGTDGVYFPATALLESPTTIRVSSSLVTAPSYVRYAVANLFTGNLFNAESPPLPVRPFRLEPALLGPVNLDAVASPVPGRVSLAWDLPIGATGIEVKRATQPGGPYTTLSTTATTSLADTTAVAGTAYYYLVTAKNDTGFVSSSTELQTATALIKDNADSAGVTLTGAWFSSSVTDGGYLNTYLHDGSTGTAGEKSVRFTPTLPRAGRYHVYARWTSEPNRATNAPADLTFATGQRATLSFNQMLDGGRWNWLGTFPFDAGGSGNLLIRNTGANGYVIADAVQWVLASPPSTVGAGEVTTINGNYTVTAEGTLAMNLSAAQSDQIQVFGMDSRVTLRGGLTLSVADGLPAGTSFTIIANGGSAPVDGTFVGKPANKSFVADGRAWAIDYAGGGGNDVVVTLLSAHQAWRLDRLGSLVNAGVAADAADADGDGENNLLEFVTAQDPRSGVGRPLRPALSGSALVVDYTRSKGALADGFQFVVERSTTLAPGEWHTTDVTETVVSEDAQAQQVRATIPAETGGRCFVRLRVTKP